jgi:hypothetical protein
MKEYTQTCTASNEEAKELTLEDIQKAIKLINNIPDTKEKEKQLGLQAMNCKYNHPEDYRMFSNEDKLLIDNAIERRVYIIRQEGLILPPLSYDL